MALAEWWCKTGLDRNELESKFISKEIGNYFFYYFAVFSPNLLFLFWKFIFVLFIIYSQVLLMVLFTGFGVFTKTDIEKGEFILEYSGERITIQEAEKREKRRKGKHSYLFYFQWNGLKW